MMTMDAIIGNLVKLLEMFLVLGIKRPIADNAAR
jgi:hypothetical protein